MAVTGTTHRSIPSLDGLRALSVLMVILGHTESKLLDRIPFNSVFRRGPQGVAVFFVISGFLITHLLLRELKRDQNIDIGRFYLRRTFRIFPPFYVFLIAVAILGSLHVFYIKWQYLLVAATYTWNYAHIVDYGPLGHCWSLCLEEQFYLLWPACMKLFSRKTNLWIALGVLLCSPMSRVATYYAWPSMRTHINMMLHTHLDTIMMGCLLALMLDLKIGQRLLNAVRHPAFAAGSLLFLVAVDARLEVRWRGMYYMTVGISLENLAIASILLYVIFRHESWVGRFLNFPVLRHVGVISYSLYLWQQLFTESLTRWFPLNIVCIFACAELSYFLVERPSFALRNRVQQWFEKRKTLRLDGARNAPLVP